MFFVVMEIWRGNPDREPEESHVVFGSSFYEAAARLAEEHIRRFPLSGRDPVRQTWWARARDLYLRLKITTQAPIAAE